MDRTLFRTLVQPFCFSLLHLSAARELPGDPPNLRHGTAAGFPLCGSAADLSEAAETSHYLKQRRCTMSQRHPFARCRYRRFGRDSQPTCVRRELCAGHLDACSLRPFRRRAWSRAPRRNHLIMHSFEPVPDSVYVAAARLTAAWRTPTVAKCLRHLPLRFSPRERVGYRLHSRQHDVQPRPCPLHTHLFHPHTARSCRVLRVSTRGVRV